MKAITMRLCFLGLLGVLQNVKTQKINFQNKDVEQICRTFTRQPYFEPEMVVGQPWRVIYVWNMKLDTEKKCIDMVFKKANPRLTNRIASDMDEYMESEPDWDSASLYMKIGRDNHELLLFPDQGPAGRFIAVPNIVRDSANLIPRKHSVPYLSFAMKLLRQGQFLVMMDCNIGLATMSARVGSEPHISEIAQAAAMTKLGEGQNVCQEGYISRSK